MAKTSRVKMIKRTTPDLIAGKRDSTLMFIEEYIRTGDAKAAWVSVGNLPTTAHMAMSKIRDNWDIVEEMIRLRIGTHVPFALNGIVDLAMNAKQEAVRLKALQDILFRAGYDAALKIETKEVDAKDMSNTQLDAELTRLLARVNNEAEADVSASSVQH